MVLKAGYDEAKGSVLPGDALFNITEVSFKQKEDRGTTCMVKNTVTECLQHADNVDRVVVTFYNLYEMGEGNNAGYWDVIKFLGLIHKATGSETLPPSGTISAPQTVLSCDEKYFDDAKVQQAIEKALPGLLYGGEIEVKAYKGEHQSRIKGYKTKDEFETYRKSDKVKPAKELPPLPVTSGGNGATAGSPAQAAADPAGAANPWG